MNKAKDVFLTSFDVEKQENLSAEKLNEYFTQTSYNDVSDIFDEKDYSDIDDNRPLTDFIPLMKWVELHFSQALKDKVNLNKFIHNNIIIDGQFLQFCKEKNIEVKCLYKDAVVSWNTTNKFEKFFLQGVFLVKSKDCEFIHSALFHKGNQNEDEIGFFVIASEKNYEPYIKIRNSFVEWVTLRDRGNLSIKVFDGEELPYEKDHTWEDLFLPDSLKKEVRSMVESFLASKDFYKEKKIPWKRGILLHGHPGCGKSSLIKTLISNYNFKPVTIAPAPTDEMIRSAFAYAEGQAPSLLYFEDLDSLLDRIDISSFLNLMDGVAAKNGMLVVATANEINKLKANITNRPSRFDRKFELPLPDEKMCNQYLNKWFGKIITTAKCKSLSKTALQNKFSYAHLKELYISSMFEAISHNKKVPSNADIDRAMKYLIKEKVMMSGNQIDTNKYFE